MTIWDELEESRRKGEIILEESRTPGDLRQAPLTDLREIEDRAREALERYRSMKGTKARKNSELAACGAVLAYLLSYSHDPGKCTESSMSHSLGIARPRLHNLLVRMEWDGVIEGIGVGAYSPYKVINLGKAMREGYLELSEEETRKLTKLPPREGWAWSELIRGSLAPSLPESELFTEATIEVYNRMVKPDEEIEPVHIPFRPGHAAHYVPGVIDYWTAFQFLRGGIFNTLTKDVLMELGVPDGVTSEEVEEALRIVGEKYLRLVQLTIKPLIDLLKEHGFEKGKTMVEKVYLRDKLLREDVDSAGRRIPKIVLHRGEVSVGERAVVPGHGVVTTQTQELTPTHVRLTVCAYRSACNFAEHVGGDPMLIEACRGEASDLESFVQAEQDEAPEKQGD